MELLQRTETVKQQLARLIDDQDIKELVNCVTIAKTNHRAVFSCRLNTIEPLLLS